MACKHWKEMAMYAEDAAKYEKPWELWEVTVDTTNGQIWDGLFMHPRWYDHQSYRRRPKLMTATDAKGKVWSWPEPMTEALERGTEYFRLVFGNDKGYGKDNWYGTERDHRLLSTGTCHLTEEAAQQHAAAMRAICNGGEV